MIDTSTALESLVRRARRAEQVALDTEFVWERTYYPKVGVVQVGLGEEECFLVDTVAIPDLSPLGELIRDPAVVKILHDAPQDLTILRRLTGASPRTIFDTSRAAGFVGLSSTLSLDDLLYQVVGMALSKSETRTNWLRRPLSEQQIAYAMDDVRYLPTLRQVLLSRARKNATGEWLQEELAGGDDPTLYTEKAPQEQFRRLKGIGALSPRQLAALRELTAWREEEARRRDRPRGHIVTDKELVFLAQRQLHSVAELKALNGLSDKQVRRYGADILTAVAKGLASPRAEWPQPPTPPPNRRRLKPQLKRAVTHLREKSAHRKIDPALVASRAEIELLVCEGLDARPERHRLLRGWRREFAGAELRQFTSRDGSR